MKKIILTLSFMLTLLSCATNDIISEQNENIPLLQSTKAASNLDKSSVTSKTITTVMDLEIPAGYQASNGGCTNTATGNAYGPSALGLYGYMVRGYGKPRRYPEYQGIELKTGNRPQTTTYGSNSYLIDDAYESAISIEFPFLANLTYEIIIETNVEDFIYKEQHDQYDQNDDYHGLEKSQAFPTLALELSDNAEIQGNNPCGARPRIGNMFVDHNYFKKQKIEITVPPSYEQKTLTYSFSTTNSKNAFKIYFFPEKSDAYTHFVPESSYNIRITRIKIIEKPFDPSLIITTPPFHQSNPCGMRTGC